MREKVKSMKTIQGLGLNIEHKDDQIIRLFLAFSTRSQYTLRNYGQAIEKFRRFIDFKCLNEVVWQDFESYKQFLLKNEKKPSPATIAILIAPLRSLYQWGSAQHIGLFKQDPSKGVRIPKIPVTSKNHYLTQEEVIRLLVQLKSHGFRNYVIGLSLIMLGLRVSELISICWSHFHTDPLGSSVWLTVMRGKGDKQREVKVPGSLWILIQRLKGEDKDTDSKLFPISSRQVERIIKMAREACNLQKSVTPHWLRHTNATLALLNGATLQQVQETLGHAKINTTQRYLHTVNQIKKAAPEYVEDCLKSSLNKNISIFS